MFRREAVLETLAHEPIDGGEKCGERFARSGRRGDQNVPLRLDGRPRLLLRRGGRVEGPVEPIGYGGMEGGEGGHAMH